MNVPADPARLKPPVRAPGSSAGATGAVRRSRRRKWCFRLGALILPFAALVLVELALRCGGAGRDLQLVERAGNGAPPDVYRFNPLVDQVYYGRTDLSGPEPRPFRLPRPPGVFRIVVVGGS